MMGGLQLVWVALLVWLVSGCATLPPGSGFPKISSSALVHPEQTRLGRQFKPAGTQPAGHSGFRLIQVGADGFLIRMQMIEAAERTLDLQYYIFRGDKTGRLLTDALLQAADRGVRVRVLVDDGDIVDGDEQITMLDGHSSIQVRVFNPLFYRGQAELLRNTELLLNFPRLNYRMHNKLFVVDNAVALLGGRNIGDAFFQIDPDGQFADDDIFAAGPIVPKLSASFDEYWNSPLSVPAAALSGEQSSLATLNEHRVNLAKERRRLQAESIAYLDRVALGEPFNGIVSGRLPLVWAPAQVVYDSPDKKQAQADTIGITLMQRETSKAALAVQSELLMVTPFLVPKEEGMQWLNDLRGRNVSVRILTNSLESATELSAQSGYMHYREPMLKAGIELYEIRSLPGKSKGSGQPSSLSRFGHYSLHAKLFVFDRQKLFIGSMNFDQRSFHINTEIGLVIESRTLAGQVAKRFEAMVQPENAYQLMLRPDQSIAWHTQEQGKAVEYDTEPARSVWQRAKADLLTLLPLDDEL